MNKQGYMLKVKELEFALTEKTKEFDYLKGEFGRLKTAYKMSEKQIRELQEQELPLEKQIKSGEPEPYSPDAEWINP